MKYIFFLSILFSIVSCSPNKIKTDLLIKNANIYTVNEDFDITEAFVVSDGKIIEVGDLNMLESKYEATKIFDANGKTIVPGLIDAHAHLLNLGISMQQVDLVGTNSYQEILQRVIDFQNKNNNESNSFLVGNSLTSQSFWSQPLPII